MTVSSYRFIDPRILTAIADLHLIAKAVVDGFMLGAHHSPKSGAGLEFNQYRSYQPGDDVGRIDWKMYGRSDRFYVRESEIDSSITIHFVLDASASMAHESNGIAKFDYARFLVASLGYLAHAQGDAIGLHGLRNSEISYLPPKREHQQLHHFLHELERLHPAGAWPQWENIEGLFTAAQRRAMIVLVSDLHEQQSEIVETLAKLSSLKNEVLLFHLLGKDEIDFSYQGFLTFADLETGKAVQADAEQIKASYVAQMQSRLKLLRQAAHHLNIAYELLTLDQPLDYALRKYLTERMKMN
jgi:uncharacterized protein (DUF58 family)